MPRLTTNELVERLMPLGTIDIRRSACTNEQPKLRCGPSDEGTLLVS